MSDIIDHIENKYKYYLRPGYGVKTLLIDIFFGAESEDFIMDFINTINSINPKSISVNDIWMNDEVFLEIDSDIGIFQISKDNWGFGFIMSNTNQKVLFVIDKILQNDSKFLKVEVDPDKYKYNSSDH